MWSPKPVNPVVEAVAKSRAATGRHNAVMRGDMTETCARTRKLIDETRELMAKADAILNQRLKDLRAAPKGRPPGPSVQCFSARAAAQGAAQLTTDRPRALRSRHR